MHPGEQLRDDNRLRIVDVLRRQGTASRRDLAESTGLSRTTITAVVGELQDRGLVVEQAGGDADGSARRGRPPTLLRLDPSAGAAVGVDFGHEHLRVAVADLSSTVLAERSARLDVDVAASVALDAAAELVEETLGEAGIARSAVVGAGMGLPGPIDRRTGTVGSSVILPGWAGVCPVPELGRRLGLPVQVDNDANLGALAETTLGAARGHDDAIYVKISSGIGAGLVLGGRLHHGATGVAGEIGHVQVRDEGNVCRCGNRGCLETVAASGPLLGLLRATHGDDVTVEAMLGMLAAGDRAVWRVLNDAGLAVGNVLGDLCNSLNPSAIVVGGDLSPAGEPLLQGIEAGVRRRAQPSTAEAVAISPAVLGDRAEVLGALALVIGDTERLRSAGLVALRGTDP